MKLAMNVGALSRKSANASTVVMFALLSITSMVDASGDMLCTCCPNYSKRVAQSTPNSGRPERMKRCLEGTEGCRGDQGGMLQCVPHPRKPPQTI